MKRLLIFCLGILLFISCVNIKSDFNNKIKVYDEVIISFKDSTSTRFIGNVNNLSFIKDSININYTILNDKTIDYKINNVKSINFNKITINNRYDK